MRDFVQSHQNIVSTFGRNLGIEIGVGAIFCHELEDLKAHSVSHQWCRFGPQLLKQILDASRPSLWKISNHQSAT